MFRFAGSILPNIWRFFEEEGIDPSFIQEGDGEILKKGTVDFYRLSCCQTTCVPTDPDAPMTEGNLHGIAVNPYLKASAWVWQIDPDGLRCTLNKLHGHYPDPPLMIVENGFGAVDQVEEDGTIQDDYRIDYFRRPILAMKEALKDGVPLIGYTTWGSIDLVSAGSGQYAGRYGFIYVDHHDDGTGDFSGKRKNSLTGIGR